MSGPLSVLLGSSLLLVVLPSGLPERIKLGFLAARGREDQAREFRQAVDRAGLLANYRLSTSVSSVDLSNTFQCYKEVCSRIEDGVVAWFGPGEDGVAAEALLGSMCHYMGIPHLSGLADHPRPREDGTTISLHPHQDSLAQAFRDFVHHQGWRSASILYWEPDGLGRVRKILEGSIEDRGLESVSLHSLSPEKNLKKLFKHIAWGKSESNFILDLPLDLIPEVLKEARLFNLTTEYSNYLITSLDLHTLPFGQDNLHTNISAFRLVDLEMFTDKRRKSTEEGSFLKTRPAVLMDSVYLFATTLQYLSTSRDFDLPRGMSCHHSGSSWNNETNFISSMKLRKFKGTTGFVELNPSGQRTNFTLELLQLKGSRLVKIGIWNLDTGIKIMQNHLSLRKKEIKKNLSGRHLRVITKPNAPYSIWDNATRQFVGYGPDLVGKIADVLNFTFEFFAVPDDSYGVKDKRGRWNGMIGELVRHDADMAVADLTVTHEREEAVDFTMPFMHLGISILYRRPLSNPPKLFFFLAPFSPEVWLYMATAYLGITLELYFLAMLCPSEWLNPHPCDLHPSTLCNRLHLVNSLWFTLGSLMKRGSNILPRAISTRMVASAWWFFTLIMISSYTANLAAFETSERMEDAFDDARDLVDQTDIQYGCLKSGSTHAFFRNSKMKIYKRMHAMMEQASPSVYTSSNAQGVERVRKGNYAFFMESTSIEYITARQCDLMQVGGLLDSKGYGIATPKGSPYVTLLNKVILDLQENGILEDLKSQWWQKSPECEALEGKSKGQAGNLGISKVGGVFLVLAIGLVVGVAILYLEYVWKTKKIPRDQRDGIHFEFLKELRETMLRGRGSTRPASRFLSGLHLQ